MKLKRGVPMIPINFHLYEDGAYDVLAGDRVLIRDCFPSINERPLRVKSVSVTADEILYHTREGTICLNFLTDTEGAAVITRFREYRRNVRYFSPLGNGECLDLNGLYQAARGIGGQCGWLTTDQVREQKNIESSGLVVMGNGEQRCLSAYSDNFSRYDFNGLFSANGEEPVLFSARYTLENLNQPDETLPPLRFVLAGGVEDSLNYAASAIAKNMKARQDKPSAYHWCSWYYCYQNFDQAQLEEYLEGMKECHVLDKMHYIQIDAGYFPSAGDWLISNERWPQGLKGAFDTIKKHGAHPAIWIGPYMVGNRSVLYREHPDWILHKTDGKPLCPWEWYNEPKVWGFQDEEYYVLDTSHPEAMEYIRGVFRSFRAWGAELFKTDFMFWGYVDSSTVTRHSPGKTSIEYFREFLQAIREEIGEESYWLGCIAPFLPFIGYADGMRVGGDVGSQWKGGFNPQSMIQSVVGNNYTNHLFYQNDPDALLLRDFFIKLTDTEVESLTLLAALSGGCVYTSDPVHKLREDRLALLNYIEPEGKRRPTLPYINARRDDIVLVHRNASAARGIVFIFNKTDAPITAVYPLGELGFSGSMRAYDYRARDTAGVDTDRLLAATPAHGCNLFFLTSGKDKPDYDMLWRNI
jgi:hypothetical protein